MSIDYPQSEQVDVEPTEAMRFLTGSPIRRDILAALNAGDHTGRELRDSLGEARTTVYQNVQKMLDRGWIEETADGYRTTSKGAAVYESFEQWYASFETVERLSPFLEFVPVGSLNVDVLGDATVRTENPHRPNGVFDRAYDLLGSVDRVRVFTSTLLTRFVERGFDRMAADELTIEMIVPDHEIDAIRTKYDRRVHRSVADGHLSVYRYDDRIPFEILEFGDYTVLSAANSEGISQALLELDSEPAVAWATERYESVRADATRLSADDFA